MKKLLDTCAGENTGQKEGGEGKKGKIKNPKKVVPREPNEEPTGLLLTKRKRV